MNPLRIIDYIRENKLTKTQFCKMCNISTSTLDTLVYYGKSVDFSIMEKIAEGMNVGVYALYTYDH